MKIGELFDNVNEDEHKTYVIAEIGTNSLEDFDSTLAKIRRMDGVTSSETSLLLSTRKAR